MSTQPRIEQVLPNGWRPRQDQLPLWSYMERGGRRAVEIAHRRWGKDDVALHWTAVAANDVGYADCVGRVGTYWHMLPKAAQARKAIWEAVNPRTGKRRVDEAFPAWCREDFRESDMFIRFRCGSTWQVVGSDNFDNLVGSPPIGVVYSEWALANPRAWAMLRPILDENGGWAMFITTPRGRNHAKRSLDLARKSPHWHGEQLTAFQTSVFGQQQLVEIRSEMMQEWGAEDGEALFDQEYGCSFDAPLVGAYYAKQMALLEAQGRFTTACVADPAYPVETAWDLGLSDDMAIWWFQVIAGEVRVLAYHSDHGKLFDNYAKVCTDTAERMGWRYYDKDPLDAYHWVPWDAAPKTLASKGKSLMEIAWNDHGMRLRLVPNLSVHDGILATRKMLQRAWFHETLTSEGRDCLINYQREWDDDRKVFKNTPLHNWCSHGADAGRMMAIAIAQRDPLEKRPSRTHVRRFADVREITVDEAFDLAAKSSGWREEPRI